MHAATATLTSEEDSRARDALDARGLEGSASTGRQRSSETPRRRTSRSAARTLGGHVGGRQHGAATGRAARVLAGAAGESEDDYSDVSGCARSQARRFAL
jgi:hypothetical protein